MEMKTFITGHRQIKIPVVIPAIEQMTKMAIEMGANKFLCGMALGTDQLAGQIWSDRNLYWEAILPCPSNEQSALWNKRQQVFYHNLLAKATKFKVLYPKYSPGVMQGRNQWLVNHSDLCLAVWDGRKEGGTYLTVQLAIKANLSMIVFSPETGTINFIEKRKEFKQLNLF